jgi:hypothetical protein
MTTTATPHITITTNISAMSNKQPKSQFSSKFLKNVIVNFMYFLHIFQFCLQLCTSKIMRLI